MSKKPYIITIIRSRRWGYYGHALRKNDTKIPKQLTKGNTTGKRKRGRPKETLRRTLERMQQLTESVGRKWSPPYALAWMQEDSNSKERLIWCIEFEKVFDRRKRTDLLEILKKISVDFSDQVLVANI